jgi:hypothetical protein
MVLDDGPPTYRRGALRARPGRVPSQNPLEEHRRGISSSVLQVRLRYGSSRLERMVSSPPTRSRTVGTRTHRPRRCRSAWCARADGCSARLYGDRCPAADRYGRLRTKQTPPLQRLGDQPPRTRVQRVELPALWLGRNSERRLGHAVSTAVDCDQNARRNGRALRSPPPEAVAYLLRVCRIYHLRSTC